MTPLTGARAFLTLGWLTAATFATIAILARYPVPYRDDWDWLAWLLDEAPSAARLFLPQGQHLMPLPLAVLWLQSVVEGVNGHVIAGVALLSHAGVVALYWREVRGRWAAGTLVRQWAIGALLVLLCFGWQLQSMIFAAAVLFPLLQCFATAAVSAVAAIVSSPGPNRPARVAAALASLGAMLTTTNGIVVPALVAALAVRARRARGFVLLTAGLAAAGVVAFVLLVLADGRGPSRAFASPREWLAIALYFAAFFGSFLTAVNAWAGASIGAALLVAGAIVMAAIVRSGPSAPRLEWFALGAMSFALVSAALAAVARAPEYGVSQAAQSRYATLAVAFWTALVLAAMSLADRGAAPRLLAAARPVERLAVPAAALLFVVHLVAGGIWLAKAGNVAVAGLAVMAGVEDDEWVRTLHASPAVVYDVIARARDRGDRSLSHADLGRPMPVGSGVPSCHGGLEWTAASEGRARRVSGPIRTAEARGWIVDRSDTVVGLAMRAPLVDSPAPAPADIIAVVRRALAARAWPADDRWVGFAGTGDRGLRLVTDAGGRPGCVSAIAASTDARPAGPASGR